MDLIQCQSFAQEVTGRDRRVDRDIEATRRDSSVVVASGLSDDVRDFGSSQRSGQLVDRCMRSHGYVHGRLPAQAPS